MHTINTIEGDIETKKNDIKKHVPSGLEVLEDPDFPSLPNNI